MYMICTDGSLPNVKSRRRLIPRGPSRKLPLPHFCVYQTIGPLRNNKPPDLIGVKVKSPEALYRPVRRLGRFFAKERTSAESAVVDQALWTFGVKR